MKIAVLNNSAPFIRGGAEFLADTLVDELRAAGHFVELVKIPLRWDSPMAVAETMVAATSIRIPEADRVIALKFPAYLVPHPNKVVWLMHQFRQVYDLWGTDQQGFPDGPATDELRAAIARADEHAFRGAQALFCNSRVTADRLARFNNLRGEVMLAPHRGLGDFRSGSIGDRIVALGRVNDAKRQFLLIEALAHTKSAVGLTIAGAPETPAVLEHLRRRIADLGLEDRVELVAEFISETDKIEMLSTSLAAAYLPVDEDSYGYVTAEAMASSRAVITCTDSGGILELVQDGVTGFVCEPTPVSLAGAMDRLFQDRARAQAMGVAASQRVRELDLSWSGALERLLS